jgi:subtilisin family serine protease
MNQRELHGGWWPSYVAHHGPTNGGRHRHRGHYHYRRDQLLVDVADLERVTMRLRALGVDCRVEERVEDLGIALLDLGQSHIQVPDLVDGLDVAWEEAPPLVGPNHVLGPCTHVQLSAATPLPTDVPLPPIPSPDPAGTGATVVILDSGFDPANEWLRGRVEGDPEKPILDDRGRMIRNCGHGTFVAGQILRYAPSARVIARRVFDSNGVVEEWELAKAINGIEGADVVNLSLGSFARRDSGMLAVDRAQQRLLYRHPNLVLVAAAGNEGVTRPTFPAADKCVIAVGSVERNPSSGRWQRASYSNHGWWVDACAPGSDVVSTFFHYRGPVVPFDQDSGAEECGANASPGEVFEYDGRARWSGTSFAAPVVAAQIANWIGDGYSAQEAVAGILDAPERTRLHDLGTLVLP